MIIAVTRDSISREWITTIPFEHWCEFDAFAGRSRLPVRKRKKDGCGIVISLPDGFTESDIQDTIGFFFDGIAEVVVTT